MTLPEWCDRLRAVRNDSGLSRAELAARAGVSPGTLKAYETNSRRPSREMLTAILDCLKLDRHARNGLLSAAGFAPDSVPSGLELPEPEHSFAEAMAEIEAALWPAFIANEAMEIVGANGLLQRLWGFPINELRPGVERNLLAILSTPRIADRLDNWDEAVGILLSMVKGSYGDGAISPDGSNPYLAAAMMHFLQGDVRYVQRALRLWAEAEPMILKRRFHYPVVFRAPNGTKLRFRVMVNPVNLTDYLTTNDFIPLDAAAWAGVDAARQELVGRR